MPESNHPGTTGPILIGLSYIGLVVFIMIFCKNQSSSFDEFSQYWGLFGTLIGVATGAIPSFFFKQQADNAKQQADSATTLAQSARSDVASANERADKAAAKAELYAGAIDPGVAQQLQTTYAHLFK